MNVNVVVGYFKRLFFLHSVKYNREVCETKSMRNPSYHAHGDALAHIRYILSDISK